jgi:hypothetical protein
MGRKKRKWQPTRTRKISKITKLPTCVSQRPVKSCLRAVTHIGHDDAHWTRRQSCQSVKYGHSSYSSAKTSWLREREKVQLWIQSRKINFEPIIGCKHPIVASGDIPIGSAGHAPDRKARKVKIFYAGRRLWVNPKKLWAYTRINIIQLIASGATPIGSADREPDDPNIIDYYGWVKTWLHHRW